MKLEKSVFVPLALGYQYQQYPQQSQQQQQQPQVPQYIPQQGSLGFQEQVPQQPQNSPRRPRKTKFFAKQNSFHKNNNAPAEPARHRDQHRWEISGCHPQMIDAQIGFRQNLVSESFPNINPGAQSCTWKIRSPVGTYIKLTWRDFILDNCGKASITIYDGLEETAHSTAICGRSKPADFVTSGRFVTIKLYAPKAIAPEGTKFMVGFEAVKDARMYPNIQPRLKNAQFDTGVPTFKNLQQPGLKQVGKFEFELENSLDAESGKPTISSATRSNVPIILGIGIGVLLAIILTFKYCCAKKQKGEDEDEDNETKTPAKVEPLKQPDE